MWSPACPASPSGSIHGPASRKAPESGRVRPQRRAAENGRRAPGAWPRPWIPSRTPPRPLLLLLLFQTEHARGDGTCARRGAYSAAKPEARARGAGLGRVVGAQQRGHVPDLGLVLGVRLRGRVRAVARRAASPRAARVRAQAPGARARARCAAPPAGGGPRGRGAPAIFKALSQTVLSRFSPPNLNRIRADGDVDGSIRRPLGDRATPLANPARMTTLLREEDDVLDKLRGAVAHGSTDDDVSIVADRSEPDGLLVQVRARAPRSRSLVPARSARTRAPRSLSLSPSRARRRCARELL